MDKLSELSKPVAEVVSKFGDLEAFGEREIKLLAGIQQMAYGTKFYSQEYVSALLAELEAKDKRIAELEGDKRQLNEIINTEANRADAAEKQLVYSRDAMATWERKAISNFEECAKMSQRIEELKKRLATPVRFPDCDIAAVSHMAHWLSDEEAKAWVSGVEFAKQQVRAAGFKCVGDEQ